MPITATVAFLAIVQTPIIQTAPFTDALPEGAQKLQSSTWKAVSNGTYGKGMKPDAPWVLDGVKLNPTEGLIQVWIRPDWPGNDGKRHVLWSTTPAADRRISLEKSEKGILRAVLETPKGKTVSRTDVSSWKPGDWHQVTVGWVSHKDRHVGLPLWVDKVAVDGPVTPYGVWDGDSVPRSIVFGDGGGDTSLDEAIIRPDIKGEGGNGMVACVYRDYFRTAPFTKIQIDLNATRVPSDRRAVVGFQKVFGLQALNEGVWEPITEQVVRYGQWAYFDAKPFIQWSTSDSSVATIDDKGILKAIKPGHVQVQASFRGMTANYPLQIITANKPDLGVICIELRPRFRSDAAKDRLEPGETTTARVRLGNFGTVPLPAGAKVRLGLAEEKNGNYRMDPKELPRHTYEQSIPRRLVPGEEFTLEFKWPFPEKPTWMKLELDPENKVDEFCEANNSIVEMAQARPIHMGYNPKVLRECWQLEKINHVGSLSYYDWIRAEKLRMDVMLREAVYPTTGPNGVEEAFRIDTFTELIGGEWEDEPYEKDNVYYDGGFPINEPVDMMAIDCAIIHEFGHTVLSQPDLYGYPVNATNVLLTDENGKPIAGTPELPIVKWDTTLAASPGVNIPSYDGYPSLMDGCQLWLEPSQAGHVQFFKGYRQDRFWGTQGRLIPVRANWLMVKDVDDNPLRNATLYVYHVAQAPVQDSGAKFFADRPKFIGHTDEEGRFTFPIDTDQDWDDPETDEVEGGMAVWNPFGTKASETAFTPNVWEVEGLLLIRIVANDKTEYQFMDLTQFNKEFLSGNKVVGKYLMNTSLTSAKEPGPIIRKPVPEAIRKVNKAPVAVIPEEMTVKCGEEFVIDGSKSYDPEDQPLIFRWNVGEGWLMGNLSQSSELKVKAPDKPGIVEYKLWVLDGVRSSEGAIIKVKVVE